VRVSYHVYLPAQHGQNERRRFPVVYRHRASCAVGYGAISAGRVQPLAVVFVNGLRNGMPASEARTMMRARRAIARAAIEMSRSIMVPWEAREDGRSALAGPPDS
jgi:hypothetical protein